MARKTKFLSRQNKVPERKMTGTALGPLLDGAAVNRCLRWRL